MVAMIVVDVNLLLCAVISGFPQHQAARDWWEHLLNGAAEVGLASPAVFGFLRIATNPRVLATPMSIAAAVGHVRTWFDRPNVRLLVPGPGHQDIAFDLLAGIGTAGNLTTDAQLAAYALELDAEIHSSDTDFARFAGLRWVNPLA
jgi:toxin-antitoxin system PIN domain toxin